MIGFGIRFRHLGMAGLTAVALGTAAVAQSTPPTVRVRGTIERVDGATITVKSREGDSVAIALREGWTVSGVRKASLDEIKPGTFVGAAAVGQGEELRALEVLVFPPGQKSNEGHYGWDLLPESTMTNATVASAVAGVVGPVLTLTFPGGEKRIAVPPDAPVVAFAPAEKTDLKPGAPVFVPAQRGEGGALSTARVIVGNQGIAPPM